jgi:hypothetical protein
MWESALRTLPLRRERAIPSKYGCWDSGRILRGSQKWEKGIRCGTLHGISLGGTGAQRRYVGGLGCCCNEVGCSWAQEHKGTMIPWYEDSHDVRPKIHLPDTNALEFTVIEES